MLRQRANLHHANILIFQVVLCAFLLSVSISEAREYGPAQHNRSIRSPDGQYIANAATYSGQPSNVHYRVVSSDGSNRVYFDTHAQYKTPNDVKAGSFSSDSRHFAAAYHYGHKGDYTWVGVWELPSGRLVHSETASGFLRDVSWVFSKLRSTNACLDQVRSCMMNCERKYPPSSYSVTTQRQFKQCKESCDWNYYTCTRQNP
jgi:hypothetical protein